MQILSLAISTAWQESQVLKALFPGEITGANCVMAHEKAIISPQKLTQECSILAQELPLEGRF
jgi:hypothetical protein